jgi:hypothetical protein
MRIIAGLKARELRWPQLDVDLSVESLEHPEGYPLVSQLPVARPADAAASSLPLRERQPGYSAKRRR